MITTVTLNASIDKLYIVEKIELGKVMRVKFKKDSAGGKGLNVARIVSLLGEEVIATGIIGGNNGRYFEELLKGDKIIADFVKSQKETKCCINVRDELSGGNTEFLEKGAEVDESTLQKFYQKFENILKISNVITISGSVPQGVPLDFYQSLIDLSKKFERKVILDTSGEALKLGIKASPHLIKPNLDELGELFGQTLQGVEDALKYAKILHQEGIETVVVSLGKNGVVVVNKEGSFQGTPPKIEAINTVGSGDSLVAGLAVGLVRNLACTEYIKLSVSAATANAMNLETGSFNSDDYNKLLTKVEVRKIQ
jgi:tagatose 6-phosphate kinase